MERWRVTAWAPNTGPATVVFLGAHDECLQEQSRRWGAQRDMSDSNASLGAKIARDTVYEVEPADALDHVGSTANCSLGGDAGR